jgi:predicted RNase H-like HicB family nuclease
MAKHYVVSDGKLVLHLHPAEEGGYTVTSPLDPGLITEAETVEEAFVMARDALKALKESRAKLARLPLATTRQRAK